ncbi:hypothetical protein EK21DRAFT_40677, partial [Setomelanomma holmii]
STPNLPYDPNTTTQCTWWIDYDSAQACDALLADQWTNLVDFRRWNPSIGPDCTDLTAGKSYCVEAYGETFAPSPSSSFVKPSSSSPSPTPTAQPTSLSVKPSPTSSSTPGNGISTPLPTQPEIVTNCDKFYFVESGDTCAIIAGKFGVPVAKIVAWNPSVGSSCGGLWAQAYACVSIIGEDAKPVPSATPTPTNPGNGISTPQPTQPNMVSNCDAFYFVQKGDTCDVIASKNGITTAQLTTWNPSAGSTCGGMWAEAYACVSIIGQTPTTPTPTPTKPPTGVVTPSPVQPGMVAGCKKFDYVNSGDTCDVIIKRNGITLADFTKWNSGVGSDCRTMWGEAYVCVGV